MLVPVPTPAGDVPRWECLGYAAFVDRMPGPSFAGWFATVEDGDRASLPQRRRTFPPRITELQHALIDVLDALDPDGKRVSKGSAGRCLWMRGVVGDCSRMRSRFTNLGLELVEGRLTPFLGAGVNLVDVDPVVTPFEEPGDRLPSRRRAGPLSRRAIRRIDAGEPPELIKVAQWLFSASGPEPLYADLHGVFDHDFPTHGGPRGCWP